MSKKNANPAVSGRDAWTRLLDVGSPVIGNVDDAQVEIAKLRFENAKLRAELKKLRAKLGRPKGKIKGDSWYLKLGLVAEDLKNQGMTDLEIAEKLREEVPLEATTADTIRKQISKARHHPALKELKDQHPGLDAKALIQAVLSK